MLDVFYESPCDVFDEFQAVDPFDKDVVTFDSYNDMEVYFYEQYGPVALVELNDANWQYHFNNGAFDRGYR